MINYSISKMRTNVSKITMIAIFLSLFSCAGYKKFDFKTAYKFDRMKNNKSISTNHIEGKLMENEKIEQYFIKSENISEGLIPITAHPMNVSDQSSTRIIVRHKNQFNIKQSFMEMTKADKKEFKKKLRQTIRDLKNENLDTDELLADVEGISEIKDDDASKKKRSAARYLLIGGGALVIIAVIVGSLSIVGTIGVVAIVAGAVLMLLSLEK